VSAPLRILKETRPQKTVIVLMNIGTPEKPTPGAVRTYLREFLSDPRVLDIGDVARSLLLNLVILPTRPAKSAAQYQNVWGDEGSPLMVHSRALERGLQARLPSARVLVAMRYGKPSLQEMAAIVEREGFDHVVLVPLYPQHASASTGSSLQRAFELLGALPRVPSVTVIPELFDDDGFLDAIVATFREATRNVTYDNVLFSYHGLPVRQVQKVVHAGHTCAGTEGASCCDALGPHNASCYRAQCMSTSRMLVSRLGLASSSTSFQSRLGRAQWLLPNTEHHLEELREQGKKDLVVLCPSFTADCLETVEEIGFRAREQWKTLGGSSLTLVPCVNAHPTWVEGLARAIERRASLQSADAHAR
jgi:ferrochelatase